MQRRPLLIAFGAALALAACAAEAPDFTGEAGALNVRAVSVDVSGLDNAVTGRDVSVTKAQLQSNLTDALTASLAKSSDPDGIPARVVVVVSGVNLTSPLHAAAAGGPSSIEGLVSVVALDGNRQIVSPKSIKGSSADLRLPGVLGVVTSPSAENDYRGTVAGFAETVRRALFDTSS
jgi:hypothetical protein